MISCTRLSAWFVRLKASAMDKFKRHQSFLVPKEKMNWFFEKLEHHTDRCVQFKTKWVFERNAGFFDVIISVHGSYPYVESKLVEEFDEMIRLMEGGE